MIDFKEFNALKTEAWKTQTKADFEDWQTKFKEWWGKQTFVNEEQKQQLLQQVRDLTEKKNTFFNKSQQRPVVNRFLLQDDLAAALAEYIRVKTAMLKMSIEGSNPPADALK